MLAVNTKQEHNALPVAAFDPLFDTSFDILTAFRILSLVLCFVAFD
jgi:hypothetical protein